MENDGMENEEKKQGKHIYAIRFSVTFLASYSHQNRTNLELDDQSHTRRK